MREAVFSSLESELGGFGGLHVLDLFAGSGALGLEAMSRGAEAVTFVESDGRAAAVVKANVRELGVARADVVRSTASAFLLHPHDPRFDLVFVDPPYAMATDVVTDLVRSLAEYSAMEAHFVVERATRDPFRWPQGVDPLRSKKYGETTVWFGRPAVRSLP